MTTEKDRLNGMKFTRRATLARIERIQQLLRQQPSTIQEIADAVHISKRYATEYVSYLREQGKLHICDYRREPRDCYQVYKPLLAWGPGADAPHPDRSSRVRQAEHRAKIADDPVRKEIELAKRRAKAIKPHMDWTSAWIPRAAS